MRLISEDGMIDLPYERVAVEMVESWDDGEGNVYDCEHVSNEGAFRVLTDPESDHQALPSYTIIAYDTSDGGDEAVWVLGVYFNIGDAVVNMNRIRIAYAAGEAFHQLTGESDDAVQG